MPALIQPKDYADLIIHVETFVKADTGAKQGSAIEKVQEFLTTGELEAVIVTAADGTIN